MSRGFKDQIYKVFRHLTQETKIILLSTTMPDKALEVTSRFVRDTIKILLNLANQEQGSCRR